MRSTAWGKLNSTPPLISFAMRRAIGVSITVLAIGIALSVVWLIDMRLGHASVFSGSALLACLFALVLIGVRRRLPILPLGKVSTWTQVHLYIGFFSSAVYWMHVPAIIGDGVFECTLSITFLIVTLSGYYGLYASRSLPKRLTAVEGQHRFDRLKWHREQISVTARELLDELSETSAIRVLGNFYTKFLYPFFDNRPSLTYLMVPSGIRRRRLTSGLMELDRYLEPEGRRAAGKLIALVRHRDNLDYQLALQLRLRVWLVIHGTMSTVLLVASIVHAFIVIRHLG
jgi:hypothetical protein